MRFLGVGEYHQLGAMYLRLAAQGHEVRVFVEVPAAQDILQGVIQRVPDWRRELDWIREAGSDGIVIFESASQGEVQDELRQKGFQVVGGSAYGDRLESDRDFGQKILADIGLQTAPVFRFHDFDQAIAFVRGRKRRYVYKNNGTRSPSMANYIGEWEDGSDLMARLSFYRDHAGHQRPDFILMDHISGIEVGVGAYFNGEEFLQLALLDWEHKRFFPGDLGELTGEMGTIVTYRGARFLFEKTLALMKDRLRDGGYCGYINLNLIVNEQGLWPLEFTCRFGYPGFAICDALHEEGWDVILKRLVSRSGTDMKTKSGFSAGVVLTVPPFPYENGYAELSKGTPISFHPDLSEADRRHFHFGEMKREGHEWVTAGTEGYVMVVTGIGADITTARSEAYRLVRQVAIPNVRYRNDIGRKLEIRDYEIMKSMGYMA